MSHSGEGPMRTVLSPLILASFLVMGAASLAPSTLEAQKHRGRGHARGVSHVEDSRGYVRDYYLAHPVHGVRPLPKGIRKKLAKGKRLPPGIAKKLVIPRRRPVYRHLPREYVVVEAGLDVLIVEAATGIVREVLWDILR